MITVNQLSYKAGNKHLLNRITFDAKPGEVLAVIGANGAGKSTLLKLLSRELTPAEGSIYLNDKDLVSYPLKELAVIRAVLTQHHTIGMSFTVHEMVLMGRYPHFDRHPSLHDHKVTEQAMQSAGILHLSGRLYDTLSGGEQQRVHLARVIAQILDKPGSWLLLDEPTNGLDLLHQQQLLMQARQMADSGFGVICILHDMNQAAAYADKILVLKQGWQLAYGTPTEILSGEIIHAAFGVRVQLLKHDEFKHPIVIANNGIYNTNLK